MFKKSKQPFKQPRNNGTDSGTDHGGREVKPVGFVRRLSFGDVVSFFIGVLFGALASHFLLNR